MLIHQGTIYGDHFETVTGEDDLVLAGKGDDRIRLSSGTDLVDGEEGFDQLFYVNNDYYGHKFFRRY